MLIGLLTEFRGYLASGQWLAPEIFPYCFCHADFADDADFSSWKFFGLTDFTDFTDYADFSSWKFFYLTDFTDYTDFSSWDIFHSQGYL